MSGELRVMCQKYENDIKILTHQLEELKEKNHEFENFNKDKESVIEEKESLWIS